MHVPHSQHSTVLAMQTTSKEHFPITDEPLTNMWTERRQWVEAQGLQTALAYKSWLHSTTSNNTLVKMQKKENFELADADGGGTIDKSEFGALLAAAGEEGDTSDMMALFAEMDKDGDGELTQDEIKALQERKRAATRMIDEQNKLRMAQSK